MTMQSTSGFHFVEGEVLLLDKPFGHTSFNVVNRVRGIIKRKLKIKNIKVGHAGTLDPLATGLLVVCTGHATKTITSIQDAQKEYAGTITLGATTPSYDLETEIDEYFPIAHITNEMIHSAAKAMQGDLDQMPPVFSAKQIDGKRAYDLARAGKQVALSTKRVTIDAFEIGSVTRTAEVIEVDFKIACSKGTYIRSIAFDFGNALHSGGYLSSLKRTRIGKYAIEEAITPDQFQFLMTGD